MQAFASPIDPAFVGQLAKHALKRGAIGVLGAKGLRDFPDPDFAAARADEFDKLLARGKAC